VATDRDRDDESQASTGECAMKIEAIMTKNIETCEEDHGLDCAARIMWETDCGVVPIVDGHQRIVGMITDRDICMAALIKDARLSDIRVSAVCERDVVSVDPSDSVENAQLLMQQHRLRRLAVTDADGRLVGIVSLNDLARNAGRAPRDLPSQGIATTLAAISQPRDSTSRASSATA
jgi:CBS domain-containing protein